MLKLRNKMSKLIKSKIKITTSQSQGQGVNFLFKLNYLNSLVIIINGIRDISNKKYMEELAFG